MQWNIYLSGEIHTDWREEIIKKVKLHNLPINFTGPITDHELSDNCGVNIMGKENDKFWHDNKSAKLNSIRTRTFIEKADIIIIRFGDKYKQWIAAFEAGFAAALSKSLIVMHNDENQHALKEIDASALAVTKTVNEVVNILKYITHDKNKL